MILLEDNEILVYGGTDKKLIFYNIQDNRTDSFMMKRDLIVMSLLQIDENNLIVGSNSYSIHIFDIKMKFFKSEIETNASFCIVSLFLSKFNGRNILITGSNQGIIKLFENEEILGNMIGHEGSIDSIIQLKNKNEFQIVSSDSLGRIILWDIENRRKIHKIDKDQYLKDIERKILYTQLLELVELNLIIHSTDVSTLTFLKLEGFEIVRRVELVEGVKILKANDGAIIFNINSEIIIWR